ncbi:MAG: hypothetical protein RLZZ293_972 [Pseudomonadota bacterium]
MQKLWKLCCVGILATSLLGGCSGGGGSSSSSPVSPTTSPIVIENAPGGSTNIVPGGSATFNISLNNTSSVAKTKLKALTDGNSSYTVELSIQNASTGITLSTTSLSLTSQNPSSSFVVNVASNVQASNPNQGMAIIAKVNGQIFSFPLNIKVVKPGSLAFTNSTGTVNLLLGSTQQATLTLTPDNPNAVPSVVANIASNSANLLVTPAQCILNGSNLNCTVTLIPQGVVGNYQISATASGYQTQNLNVVVGLPGNISFDTQSVNMLSSSTHSVNLSLSNASASDPAQTVYLSTSDNKNLTVSPASCNLSYTTPTCQVNVTTSAESGNYRLFAQANGVTIAPVYITAGKPGSLVFQESSQEVLLNNSGFNVNLNLLGASDSIAPILVNFTSDNSAVTFYGPNSSNSSSYSSYICASNNSSCQNYINLSGVVNNESGTFHVYAQASGYPTQIFTIYALNSGVLQFSESNVNLLQNGIPYTTTLKFQNPAADQLPLTVNLSNGGESSVTGATFSPYTCTFTNDNLQSGCQITITPNTSSSTNYGFLLNANGGNLSTGMSVNLTPNNYSLSWIGTSDNNIVMAIGQTINNLYLQSTSSNYYYSPATVSSSNPSGLTVTKSDSYNYYTLLANKLGDYTVTAQAIFANAPTVESALSVHVVNPGYLAFTDESGNEIESVNTYPFYNMDMPTYNFCIPVYITWKNHPDSSLNATTSFNSSFPYVGSFLNLPQQDGSYSYFLQLINVATPPSSISLSAVVGPIGATQITFSSYPTLIVNNTGSCSN